MLVGLGLFTELSPIAPGLGKLLVPELNEDVLSEVDGPGAPLGAGLLLVVPLLKDEPLSSLLNVGSLKLVVAS